MRRTVLLLFTLLLPLLAAAQADTVPLRNMPPDSWGGRHAHFGYSAAMGLFGPELLKSRTAAGIGCMAVGVLKEWKDYRTPEPGYRHGLFSRHDLQMDALGCAVGLLGNWGVHLVAGPSGAPHLVRTWELK